MENRILRPVEVRKMLGISRSTFYRMRRDGNFPKAVQLGPRAIGFRKNEVEAFLKRKQRKQRDPR